MVYPSEPLGERSTLLVGCGRDSNPHLLNPASSIRRPPPRESRLDITLACTATRVPEIAIDGLTPPSAGASRSSDSARRRGVLPARRPCSVSLACRFWAVGFRRHNGDADVCATVSLAQSGHLEHDSTNRSRGAAMCLHRQSAAHRRSGPAERETHGFVRPSVDSSPAAATPHDASADRT